MKNFLNIEPEAEALFANSAVDVYFHARSYEESSAKLEARKTELDCNDYTLLYQEPVYSKYIDTSSRLLCSLRECGPEMLSLIWVIAKLGEARLANGVACGDVEIIEDDPLFTMMELLPHPRFAPPSVAQTALFVEQIVSIKKLSEALRKGFELACDTGLLSNGVRETFKMWGVLNG